MTEEEFETYLAEALDELEAKQDWLMAEYGIGMYDRFHIDYTTGRLVFFEDGDLVVETTIVPVATHVPKKYSLQWAWVNIQLPSSVRQEAAAVKELSRFTGFELFEDRIVKCDAEMAWKLTASACQFLGTIGAYRVPHGKVNSYVLIKSIMLLM